MKKLFFITLVASASLFFSNRTNAQVGQGGFPKSMMLRGDVDVASSTITLERPDYEKLIKEDATRGEGTMYRAGITLPANIDFHKSGSWTYLENGEKIWKLSIHVPDAMGVVLMYEKYHLPKGVTLYISNENGKQIIGGYTELQNPSTEFYSNEPIVGSKVNIEMNFGANANISEVQYIVKFAAAIYRGLENERTIYDQTMDNPVYPGSGIGLAAACHVNAICAQATGYENERKAVARILISPNAAFQGVGWCSGTLINNTGNTAQNCRPLFATASHCDGENGWTDAHFDYWQFRFNYLSQNCDGTGIPGLIASPVLTNGAKFVSRSNYPSMPGSATNPSLVQDFLILELNDGFSKIPGAYLAGWSRKAGFTENELNEEYLKFVGLHQPAGDLMKVSSSSTISGGARFNQNVVSNTHWNLQASAGGSEGGASGSSLFDAYNRSMGVLSGGPGGICPIDGRTFGQSMSYSKFSYGWENQYDQENFPATAGAQSRLKEAFDPVGSGAMYTNTTPVDECVGGLSVVNVRKLDPNTFALYPNPSANGIFNISFNLPEAKNEVSVVVYNALGQVVKNFKANSVTRQSYTIDCSHLSAGVYNVNVIVDGMQLTKLISITK